MSNDLQKLFKKFMEEYESELNAARKDKDFKRPLVYRIIINCYKLH